MAPLTLRQYNVFYLYIFLRMFTFKFENFITLGLDLTLFLS